MDKFKRILLLHTAFLGDIVLATALIRETRRTFPQAKIDFLTTPRTYDLIKHNHHLDDVILFDKHHQKLRNFARLLPKLWKKNYDLAITPHSHLTTNFLILFAGIKQRVGFDRYRSRRLLTTRVVYPKTGHVAARYLSLLRPFTDQILNSETELFLIPADIEAAQKWLIPGKKPILLAPGSVWQTKRLPKEHYSTISKLLAAAGYDLVFIGSKNEYALSDWIINDSKVPARNSCGKLKIMESAALISSAKLLITNDSGPLHLANAVNTPVYAFFGPTVKEFGYFPYRPDDKVFEVKLNCRPCGMHGNLKCPLEHHNCLKLIQPAKVVEEIKANFLP